MEGGLFPPALAESDQQWLGDRDALDAIKQSPSAS